VGKEELLRMRLEDEDTERHAHFARDGFRLSDDLPVAEMHAVEIAERIDRAPETGRYLLVVTDDLHGRGPGLRAGGFGPRSWRIVPAASSTGVKRRRTRRLGEATRLVGAWRRPPRR